MKTCRECGVKETLEAPFYKSTNNRCKSCTKKYHQEYRSRTNVKKRESQRNKDRIDSGQKRAYHLKSAYGITPEKYDEMLAAQGGVCGICKGEDTKHKSNYFAIDHNHSTGEVRGLLCGSCNTALGLFGDSVDSLMSAAAYLMSSTDILAVESLSKL
jgi:hypothetical protein